MLQKSYTKYKQATLQDFGISCEIVKAPVKITAPMLVTTM